MEIIRGIIAIAVALSIYAIGYTFGSSQKHLGSAVPSSPDLSAEIQAAQEKHFIETGEYFAVIEYETPTGTRGYELDYQDATNKYNVGFGPEAAERTVTVKRPTPSATSSNAVR